MLSKTDKIQLINKALKWVNTNLQIDLYNEGRVSYGLFNPKCCGKRLYTVNLYFPKNINIGCKTHKTTKQVFGNSAYVCSCPDCTTVYQVPL